MNEVMRADKTRPRFLIPHKLWSKAHKDTTSGKGKKVAKKIRKGVDIWDAA
jgi:hypothetical protein